jgi:hypothetical protein
MELICAIASKNNSTGDNCIRLNGIASFVRGNEFRVLQRNKRVSLKQRLKISELAIKFLNG